MSTTVLIAEKNHLIRIGLHAIVEQEPDHLVVGHATDCREAQEKAGILAPDLVLLDMSLTGANAIDLAQQIRRRRPQQRILALGDGRSDIDVREALQAGCTGYLLKQATRDEVLQAIRAAQVGRRYISHELADVLMSEALRMQQRPPELSLWERLSARERSVFKLIANGGTNRTVASALSLSPKTVEKHRANLMRKVCARSAVELMLIAVEIGIARRPELQLSRIEGHAPA